MSVHSWQVLHCNAEKIAPAEDIVQTGVDIVLPGSVGDERRIGIALEDLAAAAEIFRPARKKGIGLSLSP